jgi:hypothetical protein
VETPPDLRLNRPFPELKHFVDTIDLKTADVTHVSAIVLIIKALDQFEAKVDPVSPSLAKTE